MCFSITQQNPAPDDGQVPAPEQDALLHPRLTDMIDMQHERVRL